MHHRQRMLRSAAVESLLFATLLFGFTEGVLAMGFTERTFDLAHLLQAIGIGTVIWFGLSQLFHRSTSWRLPTDDLDWLQQQLAYLRLQPAKLRRLGPGGRAYRAPVAFHYGAELWVRPAATPGMIRVDGPRQLVKKLEKRYAKRAMDQA